jgi:hypothetical protein
MSLLHFRTQAHHLPELELDPPALDAGRSADEADYAEEHAREALAAEMAALRAAAPQPTPDPDGARLMMEHAADHATPSDAELAADEGVSAFLDASRDAFVDWLSAMGSDPHAARPGVVGVRPSTPAPAAAAQAVAS